MTRDDFSEAVKRILAGRVGNRCSNPACRLPTIGASDEGPDQISNVGVAAHITAAAPGGPRYDASLTPAQRSSPDNGVWLCHTHGRAVDNDETRYSELLLRKWRILAEKRAADDLRAVGYEFREHWRTLVAHEVIVSSSVDEDLYKAIESFLRDVGAPIAWGHSENELTMQILYEIAFNSFRHGNVGEVILTSADGEISLSSGGSRFGKADLLSSVGKGGKDAVSAFDQELEGALSLGYQWTESRNRWSILDIVADEDGGSNPCGIRRDEIRDVTPEMVLRLSVCEEIHVYPPRWFTFSHANTLADNAGELIGDRKLVMHSLDPDSALGRYVARKFPGVRFTG